MLQISEEIQKKKSPTHRNFLKLANIPYRPNIHITIINLGIASSPPLHFFPQGNHERRNKLMDFHPHKHDKWLKN